MKPWIYVKIASGVLLVALLGVFLVVGLIMSYVLRAGLGW